MPTNYATAWIEGFLRSSGLLLIHYRELFGLLGDIFREIVPYYAAPSPTSRCPSGGNYWS